MVRDRSFVIKIGVPWYPFFVPLVSDPAFPFFATVGGMSELLCYRCGKSLAALSLPLSRFDECPACSVYLHCCRMCRFFDAAVVEQCTEDDADEVRDKIRSNFCDYFKPGADAFDPAPAAAEERAKSALGTLFSDASGDSSNDARDDANAQCGPDASSDAKDLFR